MNLSQLANPRILEQPTYTPGKPIEDVAEENGLALKEIIKLASNENPWGASPDSIKAGQIALEKVHLYPEGSGTALRKELAKHFSLQPSQFILGNGSNEIIELLGHVFLNPGDEVVFGTHAFSVYRLIALLMGAIPVAIEMPDLKHDLDLALKAIGPKTKIVFLPSPNNPTGTRNTNHEIYEFINALPDHVIFCLDEAYAEYLEDPPDLLPFLASGKKIIAMRTFSKIYGLAGLRIGYAYASNEMIDLLQKARQPFNVNSIAQASAIAALKDQGWVRQCRKRNFDGMCHLEKGLNALGIEFVSSAANFILTKVGDGKRVSEYLQNKGIIVRPLPDELSDYVRISIGTEHENEQVLDALKDFSESKTHQK